MELNLNNYSDRAPNGKFKKGCRPHNKGKKWDDWLPKEKQDRIREIAIKNLKPNYNIGGQNKRTVFLFTENWEFIKIYPSLKKLADAIGSHGSNISKAAKHNILVKGYRVLYADDPRLSELMQNQIINSKK